MVFNPQNGSEGTVIKQSKNLKIFWPKFSIKPNFKSPISDKTRIPKVLQFLAISITHYPVTTSLMYFLQWAFFQAQVTHKIGLSRCPYRCIFLCTKLIGDFLPPFIISPFIRHCIIRVTIHTQLIVITPQNRKKTWTTPSGP